MDAAPDHLPTADGFYPSLPIVLVRESALNPRKHFDEKALDELTENVRERGILSPLLVRPGVRNTPEAGTFEIAAGHRRYRAATRAGLDTVPAIVRAMDDDEFLELLTIENLHRDDLHPLEEAEGYETLMARRGYDVETLAAKIGKSLSYVYQRLKLLALIPAARKRFLAGELTAGHAVPLARLTDADQKTALEYLLHRDPWEKDDIGPPSVQAFRAWIGQELILDLRKAPFDPADELLVPKAGACSTCPKRSGAQPALFSDLPSRDLCTDRACHATKVAAHITATAKALEKNGETVLRLSTNHHLDPEERKGKTPPLNASEWRKAGAIVCDKTATGIVVSGYQDRDGGIGKTFKVCVDPRCKVHAGRHTIARPAPKPKTPAERRKERDAYDAEQVERLTLANLNRAIVDHATAGSGALDLDGAVVAVELLRLIARGLVREMWSETRNDVARRRGWLPERGRAQGNPDDGPIENRFGAEIEAMPGPALVGLCVELALGRSTGHGPNYRAYGAIEEALELPAVAARLGLDVGPARAAAEAAVGIARAKWNTEELARAGRKRKKKAPAKPAAARAARFGGKKKPRSSAASTPAR